MHCRVWVTHIARILPHTDLTDKTVVLTGASGGVGVALTIYLLAAGLSQLVCQYRTDGSDLFAVMRRHGLDPDRHCFRADLSEEEAVRALGANVRDSFGSVWGLINLAGASSNAMSWKLSLDDFQRVLADNLTTTFLTCREFVPGMRDERAGRIINILSVVAFTGVSGASHYAAAKAGIVGFTKAIATSSRHVR